MAIWGDIVENAASPFRYCVSEKYKLKPIWLLDNKDLVYFEIK